MRKIQLNKIYCIEEDNVKTLVVCKRHENFDSSKSWEDVEIRHLTPTQIDEIKSIPTQLGKPELDNQIVIRDAQGNEYNLTYRNQILSERMLYEVFGKFLDKPLTKEQFATKTKCRISLD